MSNQSFVPLAQTLPYWPNDIFGQPDFLREIGLRNFDIQERDSSFKISGSLLWFRELSFDLPLLKGFSVALLSEDGYTSVPFEADIGSDFILRLPNLSASFRLSTNLLQPVRKENEQWIKIRDARGNLKPAELRLSNVGVVIDLDGDIEVLTPSGAPQISMGAVELGETGFVLEIDGVAPYFSAKQTPPEGAEPGFRGIAIRSTKLHLPNLFSVPIAPTELIFENLLIGTGGFSGTIRGTWNPTYNESSRRYAGRGSGTLFGISFALKALELKFQQNVPTKSTIQGELVLPFFDKPIGVDAGIGFDGKLTATLSSVQPRGQGVTRSASGLVTFSKGDFLEVTLESLSFQVEGEVFSTKLSGKIKPKVGTFDWPTFQVRELVIDSNGNVKLEDGWQNLREQYTFNLHGFRIEITRLGFGKTEDGGKWIGFSGSLKLVDGVQAGASVEGLRITWYENDPNRPDPQLTLNGVGVEFEVPNVLRFKGAISYEDAKKRFVGSIRLNLISLNLQADAKIVFGSSEDPSGVPYTYFAIYLGVELPAGIPLWSTGLALYGMAGLFALQYEPNKAADEEWYSIGGDKSYYHRSPVGVTDIQSDKWHDKSGSLALGAGVTLGTVADNGFAFSGRLMLIIAFPGPVLMIEGRANLLKERSKLDDEPIFRALAVLDNRVGTFLVGLDAQYKEDRNGRLIDIRGGAEAFFSLSDASAWHLYLGEKETREKRIRAKLFSLFEANAYFMLDAQQLAVGVWIGYNGNWTFGPVAVTLEAWLEANALVSWQPSHFHGDLWLHGKVEVKVFGIGIGLTADAKLAADVFDPFLIKAELKVAVKLFWPLPDFDANLELQWGPEPTPPPLPLPLKEVAIEHFKVTTSWTLPRDGNPPLLCPNYDKGEGILGIPSPFDASLAPPANSPVVPLDCRPHITFSHPIHDDAKVGVNINNPNPAFERIGDPTKNEGQINVRYGLTAIELERWNPAVSQWQRITWATEAEYSPDSDPQDKTRLYGSWAPVPAMPDGGGENVSQVKLWLWSKTPFDYTRHTGRAWDEWFSDRFKQYPCPAQPLPDREICYDFESLDPSQTLPQNWIYTPPNKPSLRFNWASPKDQKVTILEQPIEGSTHALCFPSIISEIISHIQFNTITIDLPELAKSVTLVLGNTTDVSATGFDSQGNPYTGWQVTNHLIYVNGENLSRIVLSSNSTNSYICLLKLCLLLGPDPAEAKLRQDLTRHLQQETARWSSSGNVLEPHTNYRLKIVTKIQGESDQPLDENRGWRERNGKWHLNPPPVQTEYAYFKTEGPPGITKLLPPSSHPTPAEFASGLDDLTRYVHQTIPATVPSEGEKPLLPRPVYRAYDVGIEFNEDYVELMYRLEYRNLGIYLYDNNNRPARDAYGRVITINNRWGKLETLSLSEGGKRWIWMLNKSTCAAFNLQEIPIPHNDLLSTAPEGQLLDADTLYEARLTPLLLHEDFKSCPVGSIILPDLERTLTGWRFLDRRGFGSAPELEIRSEGAPPSHYLVQPSGIWGSDGISDTASQPGMLLLRANNPALANDHPEQPSKWTDYRFSAYLGSVTGDEAIGLVFRYQDYNNHYLFSMDRQRQYRRLAKFAGNVANDTLAITPLAQDNFVYTQNQDYLITIEAIGSSIRIYQDGALIFDVNDSSFPTGGIGLYCWGTVGARFKDIRVDDFRKEAPIAYRFKFTTSKFANFFHHMHSFRDEVWLAELTAADLTKAEITDAQLTSMLTTAVTLPNPPSEDEARNYEKLFKILPTEAIQQQPSEVQATKVKRVYKTSTIKVTNGLFTVTGTETNWGTELTGWKLKVANEQVEYTILQVNSSNELTLEGMYEGNSDENKTYVISLPLALLIQSPEPIDWKRTYLEVHRIEEAVPPPSLPRAVKLTDVTFGFSQPNEETVTLILQEAVELSGYRIEYRPIVSLENETAWVPYYTFGQEPKLADGTCLRIYAGNSTDAPTVTNPAIIRRFIAPAGDRGHLQFPPDGVDLRIVAPDSSTAHTKRFPSGSNYKSFDARVLRKADGTGFFLLGPAHESILLACPYRLKMRYHRDNRRVDPNSQVLSQAGIKEPEDVTIDIPWIAHSEI